MTAKITKAQRAALKAWLAASAKWDADTLRIDRWGIASAKRDADKTFAGNDPARYALGFADEMIAQITAERDAHAANA